MVSNHVAESQLRTDPTSGDSKRPVPHRSHHPPIPDIIPGLPLPALVEQKGIQSLKPDQG